MTPDPSVEPHTHRALAGWVVAHRALRRALSLELQDVLGSAPIVAAFSWLRERCASEVAKPDDRSMAQGFLPSLHDELEEMLKQRSAGASPEVSRAIEEWMAAAAGEMDACCASFEDPLLILDDWARNGTDLCYEIFGGGLCSSVSEVESQIIHSGELPKRPPLVLPAPTRSIAPWLIAGQTRYADESPVAVTLALGGPDLETWGAASYVLLHELVSHVAQGTCGEGPNQPKEDDSFAEGWMDFVVLLLHSLVASGFLDGSTPLPGDDRPSHVRQAQGLFTARLNEHEFSTQQRLGAEVAQRLHEYLCRRERSAPSEAFIRLSLCINRSSMSHGVRRSFVQGIHLMLLQAERPETGAALMLDRWLDAYAQTDDAMAFAQEAVRLSRAMRVA